MIIKLFLFWRIGLLITTYLGSLIFPKIANNAIGAIGPGKSFNYWKSWAQWDGGHFLTIAQNGYHFFTDYAFLPLYPFLVKSLNYLMGNVLLSGLVISSICLLIFLLIFFRLIESKYNQKIAFFTIAAFMLFPTSFFTVAFYSESLFLMLTGLCFYFLYKKNYLFAAIFCSFAALTRIVGIFLFISIIYTYFTQLNFNVKKLDRNIIFILISPLPLIAYSIYLALNGQSSIIYLTSERFWARGLTDPISTLISYIWSIFTYPQSLNFYFDFTLTIFFLTVLFLGRGKIPSSMWIFSVLVILAGISTGTLVSMPRYILASIGSFIILGKVFKDNIKLSTLIFSLSLIVQIILATLFISGYWVA